ncbi:VENN motif pre-toxin domain-containing protein [Rahnella sp. EDr1-12]|uniref:VENN motif pre-toxin domain-containing protein n=1 Tax=unclassified Rahnella TaxID=2635087 RepID=UPI003BA8F2D5
MDGSSIGAGFNFGHDSSGLTVNASGNKGKGSKSGNGLTHTETTVNTGNNKAEMAKFGTGSAIQQGLQAATAAVQGLAGGDMAIWRRLSRGASPYLAEVIHNMTTDPVTGKVNTEANLMAHAVVGAVVAQINGNSALAGASGAAMGEFIAQQLYPNIKREDLTEEQRQTISSLSTLAAGLAGGLTGDSSADAVAGAQAGKNAVENNFLGTEEDQIKAVQRHGADVLSCADNPSGTACQRGIAENKAYAGALAAAELIYLPGGMQVTAALGGTANAGIQYAINGTVNPTDVLIATYVGAFTANTGLWGTIGWNAAGGATSNYLKGDDPLAGAGWAAGGAALGYGMGKYLIEMPLNKVLNPTWKNYEWTDIGMGISKPLQFDARPGTWGTIAGSTTTEGAAQGGSKMVEQNKKKGSN